MSSKPMFSKIVIVRVRGTRKMPPKIKNTLDLLNLNKPNHCIIVEGNPAIMGMVNIIRDYVAFGNADENLIFNLLMKRAEKGSTLFKKLKKKEEIMHIANEIFNGKKINEFVDPVFRLHPPRKGYKNIKKAYPEGDLGKRDDIASLVKRMM